MASVSGVGPVFDQPLLDALSELSNRQLHPLSSFLGLVTPPRLGRPQPFDIHPHQAGVGHVLYWRLGPEQDPVPSYAEMIQGQLDSGRGSIVAVPEVAEGSTVLERLREAFPTTSVTAHSAQDPADRAKALWSAVTGKAQVLLGGRASVLAPAFPIGLMIVHQEQDRSYKEQRAPYYDARDVAISRCSKAGATAVLTSRTPSLRSWSRLGSWEVREPNRSDERRAWPAVEIIDPARSGLPRRAIAAVLEDRRLARKTMILLGRAQASRSGPGPHEVEAFVRRVIPGAKVSRADRAGLDESGPLTSALEADIVVATEAALAEVRRPVFSTVIALGVDSMLARPGGRSIEDVFSTLWEAGALLSSRDVRGRLLLETSNPQHHVVQGLTRGDYRFFAERELAVRRNDEAPPSLTLVRLQGSPEAFTPDLLGLFQQVPGVRVLGPVEGGSLGAEVLLKVQDFEKSYRSLGSIIASSRERILAEVDPREW